MALLRKKSQTIDNKKPGLFTRLRERLSKSRSALADGLSGVFQAGRKIDATLVEELEELLLMADAGIEATERILADLRKQSDIKGATDASGLYDPLKQAMLDIIAPRAQPLQIPEHPARPFVILTVGVNGVGKTTTIGKLAHQLTQQGHSVMIAAGDTFRAAAIEQLQHWGERVGVRVVAQQHGADAAAVAHDAIQAASAQNCDVVIVDSAGRQHTHHDLMEELKKIKRVIGKLDETAPHEVLMVLDAGTGQNALSQLRHFNEAVGVTGLTLTKLDGTAKGGILFAIAMTTEIPIRFIGVGEGVEDLRRFDAAEFVDAIVG